MQTKRFCTPGDLPDHLASTWHHSEKVDLWPLGGSISAIWVRMGQFQSWFARLWRSLIHEQKLETHLSTAFFDICELQTVWIFHYWNMICQSQWKLQISKFWKCRNQCSFFDSFDSDNGNKFYKCDLVKFIIDSRCRCPPWRRYRRSSSWHKMWN